MEPGVAGAQADTTLDDVVAAGDHDGIVAGIRYHQAIKPIVIAADRNAIDCICPAGFAGTTQPGSSARISPNPDWLPRHTDFRERNLRRHGINPTGQVNEGAVGGEARSL